MNLANNSCKFVQKGYIRIGAIVDESGLVSAFVEDSGPGIPPEKRSHLFEKFQISLDQLSQGTGVGLSLCRDLTRLLDGHITLDESSRSGVDGFPGTRFVIHLHQPPEVDVSAEVGVVSSSATTMEEGSASHSDVFPLLPEKLKILFVDDDLVLRRLFKRSLNRAVPSWIVQEAANGETAVRFLQEQWDHGEEDEFDLVFMDQYVSWIYFWLYGYVDRISFSCARYLIFVVRLLLHFFFPSSDGQCAKTNAGNRDGTKTSIDGIQGYHLRPFGQ